MNDILKFYLDCTSVREKYGHTHYDFLRKSDEELEQCHTFIQMAFPLKEASTMVKGAPVLDDETIAIFRDSGLLRWKLEQSWEMMSIYFLKLPYLHDGTESLPWVKSNDHNYLRLTRMILSLKLLGRKDLSDDLYNRLKTLYNKRPNDIGPVTFQYWTDAFNKE